MDKNKIKAIKRARRRKRIRSRVSGTAERPRLSVFRSNRAVYAELINDEKGMTLAVADSRMAKGKSAVARAKEVGAALAQKAKAKRIARAVFDRSGYQYIGMIKALADGAREGGLKF